MGCATARIVTDTGPVAALICFARASIDPRTMPLSLRTIYQPDIKPLGNLAVPPGAAAGDPGTV